MSTDPENLSETIPSVNNDRMSYIADLKQAYVNGKKDSIDFAHEMIYELTPPKVSTIYSLQSLKSWIHIPYFPAFHQPGWLLTYLAGPYDGEWAETIFSDVWAGITVGLTLIPQALSYATLANLQPIQGLYAAILPAAMYTFFGSSLILAVGPVAIVSLLTGQAVEKYVPGHADPAYFEQASDCAASIALVVGCIMAIFSLLNLGNIIRYLSHPVISGFTSGAACVIGLNQLKNGFGFSNSGVPQQGQEGFEYNYQVMRWFRIHFYDRYNFTVAQLTEPTGAAATAANIIKWKKYVLREGEWYINTYAMKICFGLYCVLLITIWLKSSFKESPARKKKWSFRVWTLLSALFPFIGIIIAAHCAWRIKHNDHYADPDFLYEHEYNAYYLKIVGEVPPGLSFLRIPNLRIPLGDLLGDAIPIAIVAYMESYSVARTIAAKNGQLHILNASQELWANGLANLLASVSSGYPVSGSFSRSALNYACGARTPLSKATTMTVVIIALIALTDTFNYIPQAALAAVIMAAIYNLISFTDLWEAWKTNKKDFITMLTTWVITLTFNTEIGLAVGVGCSIIMAIIDMAASDHNKPEVLTAAANNNGIAIVRLRQDLNFLTCGRLRDAMLPLFFIKPKDAHEHTRLVDQVFAHFALFLDTWLLINKPSYADVAPVAILIDFSYVNTIDLTGLEALLELQKDMRRYGVKSLVIRAMPVIEAQLVKFGIMNDGGFELDDVIAYGGNIPVIKAKVVKDSKIYTPCKPIQDIYADADADVDSHDSSNSQEMAQLDDGEKRGEEAV